MPIWKCLNLLCFFLHISLSTPPKSLQRRLIRPRNPRQLIVAIRTPHAARDSQSAASGWPTQPATALPTRRHTECNSTSIFPPNFLLLPHGCHECYCCKSWERGKVKRLKSWKVGKSSMYPNIYAAFTQGCGAFMFT